jgi:hypothetical protein
MSDPKATAVSVLRAASAAASLGAAASKDGPYAWIVPFASKALSGAADLVEDAPYGLSQSDRAHVSDALWPVLDALPDVSPGESRDIARGIAAAVTVIRRWVAG